MAITPVTVTHAFMNADGTPASGTIHFTLTKRMTKGSATILPGTVITTLGSNGSLSQVLVATDDTGTIPDDAQWRVDFHLAGLTPTTYFVSVPSASPTVDLGALLPSQPNGE